MSPPSFLPSLLSTFFLYTSSLSLFHFFFLPFFFVILFPSSYSSYLHFFLSKSTVILLDFFPLFPVKINSYPVGFLSSFPVSCLVFLSRLLKTLSLCLDCLSFSLTVFCLANSYTCRVAPLSLSPCLTHLLLSLSPVSLSRLCYSLSLSLSSLLAPLSLSPVSLSRLCYSLSLCLSVAIWTSYLLWLGISQCAISRSMQISRVRVYRLPLRVLPDMW